MPTGGYLRESTTRRVGRARWRFARTNGARPFNASSNGDARDTGDARAARDGDHARPLSFVAWTPIAGRSAEIAAALGGESYCLFDERLRRRPLVPLRYAVSAFATARYLMRRKPRAVIVTNPPLLAGYVAWAYATLARVPLVLDSHPGAFGAQGDRVSGRLQSAHRWLARRVTATMVTDPDWVEHLAAWGADGLVLHEAPPLWSVTPAQAPAARPVVLFVGTFGGDEPVDAFLDAARLCPELDIRVTGDPRRAAPGLLDDLAPNVTLTGFLGPDDYADAVEEADVLVTLSTEPTSVMRAAYEAVYAGRPLVLSDWPGLKELFPYAVPVANNPLDLARGLRESVRGHAELRRQAPAARRLQDDRWLEQLDTLRAHLELASTDPAPGRGGVEPIRVAGIPVSLTDWDAVERWARETIDAGEAATVCTVAPYQAYLYLHDDRYRRCLDAASVVLLDGNGVGLLLATAGWGRVSRMTGRELVERVHGGQLLRGVRVAVVGGADETHVRIADQCPEWTLVPGRFETNPCHEAVDEVAAALRAAGAQLVLVALGSPKQDLWAAALARLHPAVYVSVGGAVDTAAGVCQAPPPLVERLGVEFAWRVVQNPALAPRLARGVGVLPGLALRATGERADLPKRARGATPATDCEPAVSPTLRR